MKIPKGMAPLVFSYAYYELKDFDKVVSFFKTGEEGGLFATNEYNPKKKIFKGSFVRPYPKGHWNQLANMPGAMQVVGHVEINGDRLRLETMTKDRLAELKSILEDYGKDVLEFEREEFKDVMEMLEG